MKRSILITLMFFITTFSSSQGKNLSFISREGTWISVDVSPDGKTVAFDLLGHIYLMSSQGGKAKPITQGTSWNMFPRFSPDGKKILLTSDRSGSDDLWIYSIAGKEMENISNMELPVHQGTWSQDGRHVFGTALNLKVRHPVFMFNMYGAKQEIIPPGTRAPVVHFQMHPSNGLIYFEHGDGSLYKSGDRIKTYHTQTGEVEVYIDRPGGATNPSISPDGKKLAYIHRDDRQTVLVVHDLQTREEKIVSRKLDFDRQDSGSFYGSYPNMSWHPNVREIFLSYNGGIHAVDIDSGEDRKIKFEARVDREITETIRYELDVPQDTAVTRSHRWSQPTPSGILFEALGDLYLKNDSEFINLTKSKDHETNPVYDSKSKLIYYASWNDKEMGSIYQMDLKGKKREKLTSVKSQYGSIAISNEGNIAFVRGGGSLIDGNHLENQTDYILVLMETGKKEKVLTAIEWSANRYSKRPPTVFFGKNGRIYFTEYVEDVLTLKSINMEGLDEQDIFNFTNATRAVISPDMKWIAFREYHRSFVTPFEYVGQSVTVSASDGAGYTQRVGRNEDGDFMAWSRDSQTLYWTRGKYHVEKKLQSILDQDTQIQKIDISFPYKINRPSGTVAFKNVRVLTMNEKKEILENVTIVIKSDEIIEIGKNVRVPNDAKVFELDGRTVMPGMFDAHGHYGSPISALNVIEQNLYGLQANLAYGVTTMYDVYGTTQKDFWVSDMLQHGDITGPRIYSVGDPIFVTKYRTKMHRPIKDLEDALEHVQFNKDHGAFAVKDYSNHTRSGRQHLVEASRQLGINIISESFANPQMNLTQIVDGFTGLEHTLGVEPLYEDVIKLLTHTKIGITPTLVVVYNGPSGETYFHQTERLWEDKKLLNFFRKDELIRLRRPSFFWSDDHYTIQMGKTLKKLYDRGVQMHMGAHGQMMGIGAHWEMELFTHGGFSNYDAIEIATINGFRHHGLDHRLGSIEIGKIADMVIMTKNPIDNIRNSRSIEYVIKNGIVYSGKNASQIFPSRVPAEKLYFKKGE
ncbi:MAG: amidohydrolase family protein [Candidatus Neomarinimicrobiota bacterium]